MKWPLLTAPIEREDDVVAVRQRARRLAELLGFKPQDQTRIATAVSEIARNAFSYAGGGTAQYGIDADEAALALVIRISDEGPGIPELSSILDEGYPSPIGVGRGIAGARRLSDRFDITCGPQGGTTVTLGKTLPVSRRRLSDRDIADLTAQLARERAHDPHTLAREQNRELLASLSELGEREEEARRLNLELLETNRGVVALYAELEARAEQLRLAGECLEAQVAARTAELAKANDKLRAEALERERAEEQLRQSQKMEAVGQLTGGLAHDFNNLLTGISGSLELLQTRLSQGKLQELDRYVNAAQGAAKRAAALTHRLLAFSRRQTLDPKPTNINRLIASMEEMIGRTMGPAIAIEVIGAGGLWSTLVDPHQLENALLNLCINARDAMPEGGRLTIETANTWLDEHGARERELTPGQYLSLCVTDTGTGMSPEVIKRAFDPFFTTKPIGEGTGLGLSMIYGFARQSGGQIRIYSEIGRGTTMCLYLPRHHREEDSEAPEELTEAPRAEQGETVLVVDDEPTIRMLVTEVLEALDYTAIEAADGAAALKVLQSDARIDLLITDVGLPGGMNGRQVADAGRAARPRLKVLFITGYAENAVIGNGRLEPGMHVMSKPFAMDRLASRIKDLIAPAEGEAASS